MDQNQLKLHFQGKEILLPILPSTMGHSVVDITSLGQHGLFTLDPGYMSTASCESKITFIDGAQGKLYFRGHDIATLAQSCTYEAVMALLLDDKTLGQDLDVFQKRLSSNMGLPQSVYDALETLPRTLHPVAMLMNLITLLTDHTDFDLSNASDRHLAADQIIAKMPELCALIHRHRLGLTPIAPDTSLGYSASFLYMLFGEKPSNTMIEAMDQILILHADHEQNASTSTVRMAGSTGTHPFAAILAGIAALWGPAHGGANESCLNMLERIGTIDNIGQYIEKAKDKSDPFRLMGFGHRVYKNHDPRAQAMQKVCHKVLAERSVNDPLFEVAKALETMAREDAYFVERNLYPNVDFYSGITLKAMGIEKSFFTVMFALSRTVGWMAHYLEMHADDAFRISRPRQHYTGPTPVDESDAKA